MKASKNIALVCLALATVAVALLAWRQYRELVGLRVAALNRDERADLQQRIWALEKANRDLTDQLAAAHLDEAPAENPSGTASADSAADTARGGRMGRAARGGNPLQQQLALRELMNRPEVQLLLEQQRKIGIERQYATLFKNLNLSPEQAEKLKSLLAERRDTLQDIRSVAREQGLDPRTDRESYAKLVAGAQNDLNNSIRAVIGDSGLAQLQNYEQTLTQRNLVNDLQQRLSYTSTPLTAPQAEQLVQVLATTSPTPRSAQPTPSTGDPSAALLGGRGMAGGRAGDLAGLASAFLGGGAGATGGNVPVTAEAVTQAQAFLSPPQVTALQQIQQQQQAQQQLQQLIRSTMQPAAGSSASGTAGGRGRRGGG